MKVCIDHILKTNIDRSKFHYEVGTLEYLRTGILWIAMNVRKTEIGILKENPPLGSSISVVLPIVNDQRLLACYFQWFAISLSSYVRLVRYVQGVEEGKIDLNSHSDSKKLGEFFKKYSNIVIPEVQLWRDKIAAHFVIVDPRKDNIATIKASVMYPLNYARPYLQAGGFHYFEGKNESEIPKWELTKIFEKLKSRYWPKMNIPAL